MYRALILLQWSACSFLRQENIYILYYSRFYFAHGLFVFTYIDVDAIFTTDNMPQCLRNMLCMYNVRKFLDYNCLDSGYRYLQCPIYKHQSKLVKTEEDKLSYCVFRFFYDTDTIVHITLGIIYIIYYVV